MKIFFDTNVYVAEALLGEAAEEMLAVTKDANWNIYASDYLLDELVRVLTEKLGFSPRLAQFSRTRVVRRATLIGEKSSRHEVIADPADTPILRAAIASGVDYLVTNDRRLIEMNPHHGLRIVSMSDFRQLLVNEGFIRS